MHGEVYIGPLGCLKLEFCEHLLIIDLNIGCNIKIYCSVSTFGQTWLTIMYIISIVWSVTSSCGSTEV